MHYVILYIIVFFSSDMLRYAISCVSSFLFSLFMKDIVKSHDVILTGSLVFYL